MHPGHPACEAVTGTGCFGVVLTQNPRFKARDAAGIGKTVPKHPMAFTGGLLGSARSEANNSHSHEGQLVVEFRNKIRVRGPDDVHLWQPRRADELDREVDKVPWFVSIDEGRCLRGSVSRLDLGA